MWMTWWAWIAASVIFAILETLAPVFIFLGFAAGAAVVGICLAVGITFGGSIAWMLVVFAAVSLIASLVLRQVLGSKKNETKTFENDVNEG